MTPAGHRLLLAALLFVGSGAAGLAYEVAWSRRLELTFGSTVQAVATVLAVYMAGLGLGAWLAGRAADRRDPRACVGLYARLELAIGLYGALSLPLCRAVELLFYAVAPAPGSALGGPLRAVLAFGFLLPPTLLMGATLPVLARALAGSGDGPRVVAWLYAANTLGAVVGSAATGFVLLEALGIPGTVGLAVAINLAVAGLAWRGRAALAVNEPARAPTSAASPPAGPDPRLVRAGAAASFAFGFLALTLEVGWTRLFGLVFGSSSAGFALTLVGVLLGIALGSALVAGPSGPARTLRRLTALALAAGWASAALAAAWPALVPRVLDLMAASPGTSGFLAFQLAVGTAVLLPATVAFGAAFPLAFRLASSPGRVGRGVGAVYLANTAGAVLGAGPVSVVGLDLLGLDGFLRLASALLLLLALVLAGATHLRAPWRLRHLGALGLAALAAAWLGTRHHPAWLERLDLGPVVRFSEAKMATPLSRERTLRQSGYRLLYLRDGASATVTVRESRFGRFLTINGKVDASTTGDMPTQVLVGALPLLVHPEAERVMVIGAGSGVSAAAALTGPRVQALELVEIEPAVLEAASRCFGPWNGELLADPRVVPVLADGRTRLATSEHRYDLIVSQPTNPWVAGVANLFSQEFYALARERLAPGGVLCQWVQLYLSDPWMARSQVRTFLEAFPAAQAWFAGAGDLILLGSEAPLRIDLERAGAALADHPLLRSQASRLSWGGRVDDLLGRYVADRAALLAWAGPGDVLSDRRPRLEGAALRNLLERPPSSLMRELLDLRAAQGAPLPPGAEAADVSRARGALAQVALANHAPNRCLDELEALRRARQLTPALQRLAGRALWTKGQLAEARTMLHAAAGADPEAALLLLDLDQEQGRWDGQPARLARLATTSVKDTALFHFLALRLGERTGAPIAERWDHAVAGLQRFDPDLDSEALERGLGERLLALARAEPGRQPRTLKALSELTERHPEDWLFPAWTVALLEAAGEPAAALELGERLLERERLLEPWLHLTLARAALRTGRAERARELLDELGALDGPELDDGGLRGTWRRLTEEARGAK